MEKKLLYVNLLISLAITKAIDEDLPLCPTNYQFFPQTLPMHCRMPTGADYHGFPQPSTGKQQMPGPIPQGMPGPPPMPGTLPMPGSIIPMAMPAPSHKVPVIVMPFYSPDPSFKKPERPKMPGPGWKKPKRPHESLEIFDDIDTSSDTSNTETDSSSESGWWKGKKHGWRKTGRRSGRKHHSHHSKKRHNKKKKDLLTPVLQYVTKDGYVIYEKTISKGEAKDWLRVKEGSNEQNEGKSNEDQNASVHEEKNAEEEEVNININKSAEDHGKFQQKTKGKEREKQKNRKEEVTTTVAYVRRRHRKAINRLLSPKGAF